MRLQVFVSEPPVRGISFVHEDPIEPARIALAESMEFEIPIRGHVLRAGIQFRAGEGYSRPGAYVRFTIENVENDMTATIDVISSRLVTFHANHFYHRGRQCRAFCEDGSYGRPCVNCARDGKTVRICC